MPAWLVRTFAITSLTMLAAIHGAAPQNTITLEGIIASSEGQPLADAPVSVVNLAIGERRSQMGFKVQR